MADELRDALAGLDVPVFEDPPGDRRPDRYVILVDDSDGRPLLWAVAPTAGDVASLAAQVVEATGGHIDMPPMPLSAVGDVPGFGCRVRVT